MKKFKYFLILCLAVILIPVLTSCTENSRAKNFGGTMELTVPAGEKFVNSTWKDTDLWIITQSVESPNVYYMHEISSFGILEGTVIIRQ